MKADTHFLSLASRPAAQPHQPLPTLPRSRPRVRPVSCTSPLPHHRPRLLLHLALPADAIARQHSLDAALRRAHRRARRRCPRGTRRATTTQGATATGNITLHRQRNREAPVAQP